jgi:hypothetical protein
VKPRDAPADSPLVCALFNSPAVPSSCGQFVQVRQDSSSDPGWDHYQNRIVGTEMPAVIQDFGWRGAGPNLFQRKGRQARQTPADLIVSVGTR